MTDQTTTGRATDRVRLGIVTAQRVAAALAARRGLAIGGEAAG